MRHGQAVDRSEVGDMGRWLTKKGREDVRKVAALLSKKNTTIKKIVCSPLVRAVQSAELMASVLQVDGPIAISGDVTPEGDVDVAKVTLRAMGEHVLVLSHESFVSRFIQTLTGTDEYFSTSELRCIVGNELKWALKA